MPPSLASLICTAGVFGLLFLDRDTTVRTSKALWIPTLWIALIGSRSLSEWMGVTRSSELDGSPIDAAALGLLLAAALAVLIGRRKRTQTLLAANWPILIYFVYCLISAAWSYHPDIALKRWIKATGDLAIPLVMVTDPQPVAAIRRVVSRISMVLLPTSVLFIRYYPDLGRYYNEDGLLTNTGVTTNKNSLGLIVLVLSLTLLWNVRRLWADKDQAGRGRRFIAQATLLAFGVWLFALADSSTSKACFAIGGLVILMLDRPMFRLRPWRVHVLCLTWLVVASVPLLTGDFGAVAQSLNRASSLSGRTDIWAAVVRAVPSSIVGAGFESFWISPSVMTFRRELLALGWFPPLVKTLNEAHNGFIEVYLNLGWIGICLLALVLIGGYRRAIKAYRHQPELASLFLAYIASAVFYSVTEAGFRMLTPSWTFLIFAIFGSTAVTVGFVQAEKDPPPAPGRFDDARENHSGGRASRAKSPRPEFVSPARTRSPQGEVHGQITHLAVRARLQS